MQWTLPRTPPSLLPQLCKAASAPQELCESGGGRPGLPVPNSQYGLRGRKATVNLNFVKEER